MLEGRASQISPVTESSQVLFSFKSDMMLEMVLHRQKTALILNEIIKLKLHLSRYYVSQVNKFIADMSFKLKNTLGILLLSISISILQLFLQVQYVQHKQSILRLHVATVFPYAL